MRTIVVASDAPSVRREIRSAVEGPEAAVVEVPNGPAVLEEVAANGADLVVVDMQMGSMGGMAVCLELRLRESMDAIDHVSVLMLLDRRADVFLARRSSAEGWLVKPLDPIRIRRAVSRLLGAHVYHDDSYQPVPVLVPTGDAARGSPAVTG